MNRNYIKFVKSWRKKNPDKFRELKKRNNKRYNHRYPERIRFSNTVGRLVKKKVISKQPCVICGGYNQIEACTFSNNPMSPVWFCDSCHKKFHHLLNEGFSLEKMSYKLKIFFKTGGFHEY